jgi:hypothetical protein
MGLSVPFAWTAWPLNVGPIGYPETSVTNKQTTLRNIAEYRRSVNGLENEFGYWQKGKTNHHALILIQYTHEPICKSS